MSGASETSCPWQTNPYVSWRHPVARLIAVMLLILLDICVYGTDPINESRVESNVPGIGSIYNFLLRLPSNGARLCSRLGLIFLSCCAGLYVGRQWLHHWCLRDMCGLSMFAGTSGSFLTMGLGVVGACLLGGAIYNSIVPHGALRVTGETEMEARTFGKILQVSSAVAHAVAAVQVADSVMQDRQRYPNWGSHLKRHWRRSLRGWLRILCAWAAAVALLGVFLLSISGATWGELNEIARIFFASSLLFFDLFVVVQDWEFPTFQPPPDLDKPILMAGSFSPFFHCGAGSRLLRCAQGGVWDASAPSPSSRASQSGTNKFFDVTISGPWLAYGCLFFAAWLDLVALLTQLLYSPEDYGQYVDPSTSRIWTITDNSYLGTAYQSGVLQRPELVTWAARRTAVTGLPLSASAASDVLCSASFAGAWPLAWKLLAASPGLLMLAAFVPLLIFAEWLSRHPNARPALLQVAPEPEESEAPLCADRACRDLCRVCKGLCRACRGLCRACRGFCVWQRGTRVQPLPPKPTLAPLPPPSLTPVDGESGRIEELAISPRGTYTTTLTSPPPRSLPIQWGSPISVETPPGFRLKEVLAMGFELPHKQGGETELQGPSRNVRDLESGLQAPLNSIPEIGLQAGDQIAKAFEQPPLLPPFAGEESPVPRRNLAETGLEAADQSDVEAGFQAHGLFPPSLMRHNARHRASLRKTSEAEAQPALTDLSEATIYGETGSRPSSASSLGNSSRATSSRATSSNVKRMTSNELHGRARRKAMKRLDEAGHFDVLLRKQGRPLGLIFKLPEALSSTARSTPEQKELLQSLQLTVAPDGLEIRQELDAEECEEHEETVIPDETDVVDRTLLIMDITESGVADEHNRAQAAAGQWDQVILPGMHISSVNGIRRDPLAMANALSKAKVLTIRFHFLRSTDLDGDPLQINGKAQRLLEERVSKLVRMEGPQIVDSMRSQSEWEAMASSLAAALVKEVYKGDRLLQPWPQHSMAMLPAGVPTPPDIPAPRSVDSLRRLPLPSLPQGLPPLLPAPAHGNHEKMMSLGELDELSDSEESV